MVWRMILALVVAASLAGGVVLEGQIRWPFRSEPPPETNPEANNKAYDGKFVFVRLSYASGSFGGGFPFGRRGRGRGRGAPWSHDYPRAEHNLLKILDATTLMAPDLDAANIFGLDNPELLKYPLAYMAEPGYWTLSDQEAEGLKNYLLKGGFIIFDDFRGRDLGNFEEQLRRAMPEARLVELDVSHPIFHSFFEIETLDFVQFYDRGRPVFYGVFQDNDPAKRLLLIANYNNDVGEYWEYSDTGFTPIELSNEAYKLGVNYVVYAMTH